MIRPETSVTPAEVNGHQVIPTEAPSRAAREETNLYREKAWWQTSAVVSQIVGACLIGVVLYLALSSRVETKFLVQNEHGQWRVAGWDDYHPTEANIKNQLMDWLWCARSLPTDREVHRRCWSRVGAFMLEKTQCHQTIIAYRAQRKPGEDLFHRSVMVKEMRGFREPDGRWRFTWTEDRYTLDHGHTGPLESTTSWQAIMLVTRREPTAKTETEIDGMPWNPLGVYCTHLVWHA